MGLEIFVSVRPDKDVADGCTFVHTKSVVSKVPPLLDVHKYIVSAFVLPSVTAIKAPGCSSYVSNKSSLSGEA